jgi:hypothetical protein
LAICRAQRISCFPEIDPQLSALERGISQAPDREYRTLPAGRGGYNRWTINGTRSR